MKNNNKTNKEVWKSVPDFPNYQISNLGRVSNGKQIIKSFPNNSGYLTVNFWKNRKPTKKTVHRQVALLFVENPNNYPEVNHIDGDKTNNRAENLEWCTRSQNNAHALRNGLRQNPNPPALSPEDEKEAKLLYRDGATLNDLGKRYNVHPDSIKKYIKGVYKRNDISDEIKEEIKRLYQTGLYTYKELSYLFNIGAGTVGRAIKRKDGAD